MDDALLASWFNPETELKATVRSELALQKL